MKIISSGFIIQCKDGKYLLGRADGHSDPYCWTVFKGQQEPNETLIDTAIRELKEETGISVVSDHRLNRNISTNYVHTYSMKRKDVYLYLLFDKEGVLDSFELKCSSFMKNGRPEICEYRRFSLDELERHIFPSQRGIIDVLKKISWEK